MDDLTVSCRVSVPGGWLDINDGKTYRLTAEALAGTTRTWRRQDVASPFIDGTYTVNAVLENIVMPISVYVYGADHGDMVRKLELLIEAFEQFDYVVLIIRGESTQGWRCQLSDSTVDTRREFQHARMAMVTFQVPCHPNKLEVQ